MKKMSKIVFLCVLPRILSSKDVAIIAAHLVFAWSPSGCLLVSELKEKNADYVLNFAFCFFLLQCCEVNRWAVAAWKLHFLHEGD